MLRRLLTALVFLYWGIRAAAVLAVGGLLLVLSPRLNSGGTGVALRLIFWIDRYVLFWAIVWALTWWLAPDWFTNSRAGLESALQALPATIVAVLVLSLGSLFVISQTTVSTWGTRSPIALTFDEDVHAVVARPLILVIAALMLAGRVPDSGATSDAITAAVGTTALATTMMIVLTAMVFSGLAVKYTQPRSFPQLVIEDVDRELLGGKTELVVLRGPLLAEMLKMGLRRGDAVATFSVLEAIVQYQRAYLAALERIPTLRTHRLEDGSLREHWLAEDVVTGLVRGGEEALKLGVSGEEVNAISGSLEEVGAGFIRAGETGDAERAVDGLVELATTANQVTPGGAINFFAAPAAALARLEALAEEEGTVELAARALAGWSLAVTYPQYHFKVGVHPQWERSVQSFGPQPPWRAARGMVTEDISWREKWANKAYRGPDPLTASLRAAQQASRKGWGDYST